MSDQEREPFLECLRQGFADGRLTQDEFGQRMDLALTARTHGQLAQILTGLPGPADEPGTPAEVQAAANGRGAAVAAHLLGIGTSFIGPLVMVLTTNSDREGFAHTQAVEALNFQLTFLLFTIVTLGIGYLLWPITWAFCVIAAVRAGGGRAYRYPFTIRPVC